MSKTLPPKPKSGPGFAAYTTKHNGIAQSIITDLHLTPAFNPLDYKDSKKIPFALLKKRALWDTGATNSVITATTANELKLKPVGVMNITHYGGTKQSSTFMINLFLPNMVAVPGVLVSQSDDIKGGGFDVIIGMDIMTQGDFAITNVNGFTWMSFRLPSISTVDYVWEAERVRFAGADKYGPCPCGRVDDKGKPMKFKACHGVML